MSIDPDKIDSIPEEDLGDALDSADEDRVVQLVENMTSQETLRQMSHLDSEERDQILTLLTPEAAAGLVEEAPPEMAVAMLENLDSTVAARIVEELHSNTQADIVQDMEQDHAEALLSEMKPESVDDVRNLSRYDPETAGGLMELDTFTFYADDTVGTVLKRMISSDDGFERHRGQHPYIIDETGKLTGVISLRNLLRNRRATPLSSFMITPLSVTPDVKLEELEQLFEDHPFLGIPVVDAEGILLGSVSRVEVAEAELERVEHESLSRQKIGDELRSMPTWLRSRRRLAWLTSNIILNIIAASVISAYEETLAAVIAIAVFLPMVSDMSGCSGNQAVGVSMRELALGLTRPSDLFHVLKKEFSIGIINGIVLGILIGCVAWLWKGNAYLGLVIGMALSANTLIAVSIGGTVPLLLKRFGVDPAVASGPLLTTVTDMAGFFLVLSLASFFMPQLLA